MLFRFSDIIPREHGAWAVLLVPYFTGTFACDKPGIPSLLLLINVISLYLLRVCGEFYLSGNVKKKKAYPNIKSFYLYSIAIFTVSLVTTILLLFYFQLWKLLYIGLPAFFLFVRYYVLLLKNNKDRISLQFTAILGLTLIAPASYYAVSERWDYDSLLLWIFNAIFFQLGFLYVHNRIRLQKNQKKIVGLWEKLLLTKNLIAVWCFSLFIFYLLLYTGLIKPIFFVLLLPLTIHLVFGLYFDKRELNIKRMGRYLLAQGVFFLVILIALFRIEAPCGSLSIGKIQGKPQDSISTEYLPPLPPDVWIGKHFKINVVKNI